MMTDRRYVLDPSVWRSPDGLTLIGGSDFTVVGLDRAQAAALDLLLGDQRDDASHLGDFTAWCLSRNLIQPIVPKAEAESMALVIPCRDHQSDLDRLLATLDLSIFAEIIVVDDGSVEPIRSDLVPVHRNPNRQGPAVARNIGWRSTTTPIVVFLDADVRTDGAWLTQAGALLANPQVAAVAPRVRSGASSGPVPRWEQVRPALDLGPK
ncbi:MAG: glycosyltransferase, partial [Acidimicrobiales bacterium]|nr:glycosyltransferase [Acidimicrobiales bacterium]